MPGPRASAAVALALSLTSAAHAEVAGLVPFEVMGDRVPRPLVPGGGEAARGRRIVLDRETGNCLICHQVPEPAERFQGDIAPSLAGVGSRLDAGQLRLRLIDQSRLNPATIMPPYYRIDRLVDVAERYRGRPALSAAEIEDVVAYLATLTDAK